MRRTHLRAAVAALATALVLTPAADAAKRTQAKAKRQTAELRDALFVGNNWDGTATVVDPATFKVVKRFNVVPDLAERLAEIRMNPVRLAYYVAIRELIGEGHDQFVDDMFTSPDGRTVYASRPSLADVVAIDLATGKIVWRAVVDGQRADHMAISPDGRRLLVSASTGNVIDVIDTATGKIVARIPSGDSPHESNFSKDASRIFHASIGLVYTPLDIRGFDSTKGRRVFQVIDAKSYEVTREVDIGRQLAEAGYPGFSSAIRPMAISPDEKKAYFQLSFFHGFVEYDLVHMQPLRVARLPISAEAQKLRREQYVLDSAHHGLSIDPRGRTLCVAGTMSDYAALVSARTFGTRIVARGSKPYWSTNSADGKVCFVSFSGDDAVKAIDYRTGKVLATILVGDHPQRMRIGKIRTELLTRR